jgi:hypothetical protein
VVLFVGGSILSSAGQPDTSDPPAKLISYYGDSGHRDKVVLGWLIAVIGVFFLLWFVAGVREYMRRINADGTLTTLATVGGAVYAALTLSGRSVDAALKSMSDDTFGHQVFPELIHAADDAGYILHAAGGVGLGALIIALSMAVTAAGRIRTWAGWVSMLFGMFAIFSVFFIPLFLNAIWLLVASVLLFRADSEPVLAP